MLGCRGAFGEFFHERGRALYIFELFGVFEGDTTKELFDGCEGVVATGFEKVVDECNGDAIRGEHIRAATVHVSRHLIEQDNGDEAGAWFGEILREGAVLVLLDALLGECIKSRKNLGIKCWSTPVPHAKSMCVVGCVDIFFAKPKKMDLLEPGGSIVQVGWEHGAISLVASR